MRFLLLTALTLLSVIGYGQEAPSDEKFEIVEIQPEFPGGMGAFYQYIGKNFRYPAIAVQNGIEGRVYVGFIIDTQGSIVDSSVVIKNGVHESLDNEAIRLIKECPDWNPGRVTNDGDPASVRMVIPLTFKLGGGQKKKKNRKRTTTTN